VFEKMGGGAGDRTSHHRKRIKHERSLWCGGNVHHDQDAFVGGGKSTTLLPFRRSRTNPHGVERVTVAGVSTKALREDCRGGEVSSSARKGGWWGGKQVPKPGPGMC